VIRLFGSALLLAVPARGVRFRRARCVIRRGNR
jgi:hypothetical protein